MHLGIDDARQRMQAPRVEPLGGGAVEFADGRKAPVANADIGTGNAIGRGGDCAMDDQVESFAQQGYSEGSASFSPRQPAEQDRIRLNQARAESGPIRDATARISL